MVKDSRRIGVLSLSWTPVLIVIELNSPTPDEAAHPGSAQNTNLLTISAGCLVMNIIGFTLMGGPVVLVLVVRRIAGHADPVLE
ncbi:MAG: hypothetical protein Q9210_000864 [Variospora velana]